MTGCPRGSTESPEGFRSSASSPVIAGSMLVSHSVPARSGDWPSGSSNGYVRVHVEYDKVTPRVVPNHPGAIARDGLHEREPLWIVEQGECGNRRG